MNRMPSGVQKARRGTMISKGGLNGAGHKKEKKEKVSGQPQRR
jgi:hypothetical protein